MKISKLSTELIGDRGTMDKYRIEGADFDNLCWVLGGTNQIEGLPNLGEPHPDFEDRRLRQHRLIQRDGYVEAQLTYTTKTETAVCPKCGDDCRMRAQAAWTPQDAEPYLATPIPYELAEVPVAGLSLGLKGNHAYWAWKPYADRLPEHQEDYNRLLVSIYHDGVKSPVIGWTDPETGTTHVLIGQRRAEIAERLGIETIGLVRILEDPRLYWQWDLERISRHLRPVAGEVGY